ncbi:Proprotein convertase subtilisin/kexin type 5 [Labeo rohita]|uniref:Proprotein convertase subtilisin/kexin type 5 n=1 Tax=Labeo rohita TaxID=84645 RepID=A0ABQ8MGJ0_LABRO|nr:Proprotein convertase subtilisin/kexin type 5 [Labeo rohita]
MLKCWNVLFRHGTRCAGEVAASANNSHCTVGIAYNAKIGGVRMLDGDVTDMVEAKSLSLHPQHIDIYSASWGPDDDGKTVDGPASLARQAFENGIRLGRKGRGSIFVWASGNGGRSRDHCSCDGYTNSIYTISISSTAESGRKPWYLEEQRCTDSHTGTSASAPMAAGIIALALEANPFLTWRDVQHIIVKTSLSHLYGFGLMDAEAMVKEAERWKQVPPQHICVENADKQIRTIRPEHVVRSVYKATGCTDNANHHVIYLEHVVVRITITHPRRGDLSINLTSPSGTKSQLLANRLFDHSMEGFKNWEFMTTHCWGEKAAGDWILEIYDSPSQLRSQKAPGSCHPECGENGCEGPGPQQCITCLHYFLKFKNNTRMCVPECPTGFFRDDKKRCKKCSPLCESCVGSRSDQCSTCRLGLYLVEGGNNCISSYSTMCRKCSEHCRKCTLQGNKCQLSCEPGTYYNGHRRACEKCHSTCATCAGTGMEACNECAPGYYFEEWRCVSSCNVGYYLAEQTTDNGDVQKSCQKCDPTCYACAGPGERNCSICVSGYNLENGVCVVSTICKDGEYLNKHDTCELCSSSCSKCTGPESTDCISCPITRLFDNGTCVLSCGSGKFERDGQCHHCHHTCLECTDTGPDKCSCCSKDRFGVERYLFEGECRESCPEGYSHSSKGTCDPCPLNCTVCTSTGHCLHCTPFYYPKDGTCSKLKLKSSCHKICPERMFQDKLSMVCARCDDHCETCDASECYLCDEGYFLSDGTCVETCKEGFYGDMKQECEPCHHTCRSCGGPDHNDCDSCEDDMFLDKGQCISISKISCPDGKFLNSQSDCEQCDSSCWTCSGNGKEQCDSCQDGMFLTNSQMCVSICPHETHPNQTSGRCEDCSAGCLTCRDAHHCLKCKDGGSLYLLDGKCVAECKRGYPEAGECHSCAEGCASCEGEVNYCLKCEEGYVRFKHTCVHHCPSGHFIKDEVCESCPNGCAECDQMDKCSACDEYHFLHEDECLDDCPKGYFTDVAQKKCTSCNTACAECDGPDEDDCTSCGFGYVHNNGQCLFWSCPPETYLDGKECRDCDKSCLTCSGPHPSSCLTCRDNMRKDVNGHCEFFRDCSVHTFTDKDGHCKPCHKSCLQCSGAGKNQCISCNPKHFLLNQTCVSTCPGGYYVDEDKQECVQCHVNCESCSGHHSNDCITCKPGLFLLGHSCFTTCLPSYFVNATSRACQKCDHTCEECLESSRFCHSCRNGYFLLKKSGQCLHSGAISCTSCYDGFKMLGGICSSDCLFGEYPIPENNTCATCDSSCNECKGPGPYRCTSCPVLQRLTEDGRCLPCCGENTPVDSSKFHSECCQCHNLNDECIVMLSYNLFNNDPVTFVHPGLFVSTVIFVLVGLWLAIFLFLQFRQKITSKPIMESNGYSKISDGPFTSATLSDSMQAEYCDKEAGQENDEEEDEDIVYMGRDGIVYRKFKYSLLEGEEEVEEVELEYDDMYTLT